MRKWSRRDALKVAAGTAAAAACSAPDSERIGTARAEPEARTAHKEASMDAVLGIEKLGFPWQTRDPFLFCVHHDDHYPKGNEQMGPLASLAGREIGMDFAGIDGWRMYHGEVVPGFPQHPHRGFETVTVVRRGLLDHSDSMGATARYGGGDVQWLTAGAGIQHAEMFPLLSREEPNPVELFQIWLNLPRADKMVTPHFSMLWADSIPRTSVRDDAGREVKLTLIAGAYDKLVPPSPPPSSWASRKDSDLAIWTLELSPNARFALPAARAGSQRTLYFFRGASLAIGERKLPLGHLADLRADQAVTLHNGPETSELLMLQARPIAEPVVKHGPFVMNTADEIRQAYADYRATQFGGWPWPVTDPVHPREQTRFARRPDGKIETPT